MPTRRQAAVASVIRRYPLYSGCGSVANHHVVERIAGPGTDMGWGRVAGGLRVAAPLDDYVGRAIYFAGDLDRKVTWICRRLVRSGDTVVDIGANLGLVTFVLAALVGPNGTVHSFEPIPAMADLIQAGIDMNRITQVHLNRVALGSATDELELSVPNGHAGSASFVSERHVAHSDKMRVPVRRLSDEMSGDRSPVRLVKIDVEGFEAEVLTGAGAFFERARPESVLFEMNGTPGPDGDRAMNILDGYGYGYGFLAVPRRRVWMRLEHFDHSRPPVGHDVLAVRLDLIDSVADRLRVRR